MIVDKMYINYLRKNQRWCITEELEGFLLAKYGEEAFPYEDTEQDLYEQIRKLVNLYNNGDLDIHMKSPIEKLQINYSCLQQDYTEAMKRIKKLESDICLLRQLLY